MEATIVGIAIGWVAFFVAHSALASNRLKLVLGRRWPVLARNYRLAYNVVALVTLVPILALVLGYPGPDLWAWTGMARWVAEGVGLAGVLLFIAAASQYDGRAFLGVPGATAQIDVIEPLRLGPLHRHVRHPTYFASLLVIWTRPMDAAWLVSALLMTAYFAIGSQLEERKLIALYGHAYREYCKRVPGLIPVPGRVLTAAQAQVLESQANAS